VPFERTLPRSFTTFAIRNYAPASSGVYGLSNSKQWLYIGESDNIQAALLALLSDSESELMKLEPKGFVLETCDRARRMSRQERLVGEYKPICNERFAESL
jgi:hypothetical protein